MKIIWLGDIGKYDGHIKLILRDKDQFAEYLRKTYKDGDVVEVTVQKQGKDRTNQQFRYLYSCVYQPMAKELGYTPEEMDGVMKKQFLTVNPDSPIEYVRSKTDLDREELSRFIDDCRREAASMGITTPDPS